MKPQISGLRGDSTPKLGVQALIAADPLSLVLADLTQNLATEPSEPSTERPSRRRKRSHTSPEDSETSKAVEAIRAAAKIALMKDEEDMGDDDDDDDADDDDLVDEMDTEDSSRKRRKVEDQASFKSKDPKKQNSSVLLSEEERRAKKKESNNVKKVKERQRRSKMSESIHELRRLLPQCRDDKKANQSVVMMRAVEYIKHLEALLERALMENQKFRQAAVSVAEPAPSTLPPPAPLAPVFDSATFAFLPQQPPTQAIPLGILSPQLADPRYGFPTPNESSTSRASKSSAFVPPTRAYPTHILVQPTAAVPHTSTYEPRVGRPQQQHDATQVPSVSQVAKSLSVVDPNRSSSPSPRLDPDLGASTHSSTPSRHRAGKAAKSQMDSGHKHPVRSEWSLKAPMVGFQQPHDPTIEDGHLAGDIEEVDGEWPLFFQRPYLNSDFAHDNHISLDIPQNDAFGFGFEQDHEPHRSTHTEHDRGILDYAHTLR